MRTTQETVKYSEEIENEEKHTRSCVKIKLIAANGELLAEFLYKSWQILAIFISIYRYFHSLVT